MDTTALAKAHYLSITTFKRDGTPVSTPVWVAADNGTLLVHSEAKSWKVKRIRRDGHVRIAPSSARGTVHGDAVDADATIDEDTATVEKLLAQKYGLIFRAEKSFTAIVRKLRRRRPAASVTIRIVPRLGSEAVGSQSLSTPALKESER
jgi:PPOX class probable F420-dependent enzyme